MQQRRCRRRANQWRREFPRFNLFLYVAVAPSRVPSIFSFSFYPWPFVSSKDEEGKKRERQKKWGSLSRKHVLPTIRPARRRFDEHYNIIRIGLALNEVGGARAKSDKGTNKKRPLLADHGGPCSAQALRRINSLPNREHARSLISRMKERSTKSREPIAS